MSRNAWFIALTFGLAATAACDCRGGTSLLSQGGVPKLGSTLDFGNVQVGQTSKLPFTLSNTGSGPLRLASQTVSAGPFGQPTPFEASIVAGDNSIGVLSFAPTDAGEATGTLTLQDDGNPAQVVVNLRGNGVDLSLAAQPTALDFGAVPVGANPPPSQTVTFLNPHAQTVYLTLSTSSTAPQYSVSDTTVALQPNVPYPVTVTFAPDAVSVFDSTFTYASCTDASSQVCLPAQPISLSGQGVSAVLTFAPNPILFANVPLGTTAQTNVTVTNTGSASATVTCLSFASLGPTPCAAPTPLFSLGTPSPSLPATLPPNASLTVVVTYTASDAGTDALVATYTPQGLPAGATASDPISGQQVPSPCQLAVAPVSVTFPSVTLGAAVTRTLTLTNAGGTTCDVSAIALDSTSDPSFALAAGQATTLTVGPGGTAAIGVTFNLNNKNPPFSRRGGLSFTCSDPIHPTRDVPLLATLGSAYAGGGAWPRWHHDNVQSGLSPVDTSALAGVVAWSAPVGVPGPTEFSTVNDYLNSPVVGSDGTVYQLGMDGTLHAFNPDGGTQWATLLEGPVLDPHPGTPIIASDGSLYVAFGETTFMTGGPHNGLFHVSPAGAVLQALPPASTPTANSDGFDLPPILTNAGLLLGGDDFSGAFAYAIDGGTMSLVETNSLTLVSVDAMTAVVGPDDSSYWCRGETCFGVAPPSAGFGLLPAWPDGGALATPVHSYTADLAFDVGFTGNLIIVSGGTPGDFSFISNPQQLSALNPANGAVVWTRALPAPTAAQQLALTSFNGIANGVVGNSCPAIGLDGTVYVGNFDGLHAVDGATGSEKPGFPFLTSSNVLTAPAIGGDGTIFLGTEDGTFYAVHPNGTLRFKVTAGGRIAGSPAIGPSGAVYFVADDGLLYAIN